MTQTHPWEVMEMNKFSNNQYHSLSKLILKNGILKFIKNKVIVRVQNPYGLNLIDLIESLPNLRVVINYIIWRAVNSVAYKLSEPVRKAKKKFYSSYGKTSSDVEKWRECVIDAREYFVYGTNALYMSRYSDNQTIRQVEKMTEQIKETFMQSIEKVMNKIIPFVL